MIRPILVVVIGVVSASVACSSKKSRVATADADLPKPADAAPAPASAPDAAPPPASPDAAVEADAAVESDAAVEPTVPDESASAAALVDVVLDVWASAFYMAKGQWRSGSCAKGVREMNIMLKTREPERDELAVLLAKPGAVSAEGIATARNNDRSQNKDRNFLQTFQKSNAFPCPRVRKGFEAFVRPLNKAWGDRETPPPWATPK